MKVTVCFGNTRVIVPCGNGDLLVTELIDKAIVRYKKATNKSADYWVRVHSLKSLNDGGILDFDDRLSDVTDDREQIIAIYEEQDTPSVPHNGGDGMSASSVGTSSPELFSINPEYLNNNEKNLLSMSWRNGNKNDVIITHNDLSLGSSLIVRRGSEPALNNVGKTGKPNAFNFSQSQTEKPSRSYAAAKRWSAIASLDETKASRSSRDYSGDEDEDSLPPPFQRLAGNGEEVRSAFSRFARDSARRSLASNNSAVFRWMEAQQRAEEEAEGFQLSRTDPVGGSGHGDDSCDSGSASPLSPQGLKGELIEMVNEGGPLGIHVVPDSDHLGRDMGLVIQGIEAGGRIYRDGRLKVQDRIVEINGTSLVDVQFNKAQDVFKQALQTNTIQLRIIRAEAPPLPKQPPPLLPRAEKQNPRNLNLSKNSVPSPIKLEDLMPTKQVKPIPPARHPSTTLSSSPSKREAGSKSDGKPKLVAPTNTRKIGKKITINLTKGPEGLGFSVTTRDNPAGGNAPIYIKNILTKGAAVKDGTLKSGDRLLEVNDVEMTGKSQAEAVSVLRNTKLGSLVKIVVSRQVAEEEDQFTVPRELPKERAGVPADDSVLTTTGNREVLAFDIPLNDTGSAGLGVSVKGKTSTTDQGTRDLGIFIKSVITGGAASKDGRLIVNDQLLEVNGENLSDKSNADAMETLRLAMQREGNERGCIRVVIGRRPGLEVTTPSTPSTPRELRISLADPTDSHNESVLPSARPGLPPTGRDPGAGGDNRTGSSAQPREPNKSETNRLRNPVLSKATSSDSGGIRNLSYMRATHDSMLESFVEPASPAKSERDAKGPKGGTALSTTPPLTSTPTTSSAFNPIGSSAHVPTLAGVTTGEVIQIDETTTYQVKMRENATPSKIRPASTLGFSLSTTNFTRSSDNNSQLRDKDGQRDSAGIELSPTEQVPFSRDGFGRQSMSEKRHGHVDPRVSEFYRKLKESRGHSATWERKKSTSVREDGTALRRAGSAESLLSSTNFSHSHDSRDIRYKRVSADVGPVLGLKKSSSLESLQTAVQDATLDDGEANQFRCAPNRGMVRGRGCNDSFRAAVDRSYEGPKNDTGTMETPCPAERDVAVYEESSETGSVSVKGSSSVPYTLGSAGSDKADVRSSKSSLNSDASHQQHEILAAPEDHKEQRKAGKKKAGKDKEKEKSGSGIFKGLGHMFRFGKHRKGDEEISESRHSSGDRSADSRTSSKERHHEEAKRKDGKARKIAQHEHEKIQEQYRKRQEKQKYEQQLQKNEDRAKEEIFPSPPTRAERIQQLRSEHQRRHRERHGQYPSDTQDELYERKIQQFERQKAATIEGYYSSMAGGDSAPRRPQPQPGAEAYDRPGSRLGYVDPEKNHGYLDLDASCLDEGSHHYKDRPRIHYEDDSRGNVRDRYVHYQNYQEIQAQLARHEYYQQRYQQFLAHQQAALAHSAHAHHHASLSASQLMPPPLPPRTHSDFHPHRSAHRPYPATEPRGNWTDHRNPLLVLSGHPRSLTPSLPHESTGGSTYLGHPSQTPISQMGYLSHQQEPPLSVSFVPASSHFHASQDARSMDYMAYVDRMIQRQGAYGSDGSQFGSLPRQSGRSQTGTVSEAARV